MGCRDIDIRRRCRTSSLCDRFRVVAVVSRLGILDQGLAVAAGACGAGESEVRWTDGHCRRARRWWRELAGCAWSIDLSNVCLRGGWVYIVATVYF